MNIRDMVAGAALGAAFLLGGCGSSSDNNATSVSVSPSSLNVSAALLSAAPTETVQLTLDNPPSANLTISVSSTNKGISDVNFSPNSNTNGTLTVDYKTPAAVGTGTYNDTITLKACLDSACTQQIAGSPLTIASTYTVSLTGGSSSSSGGSSGSSSSSSSGSSSSSSSSSSSGSSGGSGSSSGGSTAGIYSGTLKIGSASHSFYGLIDSNGKGWFIQKDINNYVVFAPDSIPATASSFSVPYIAYAAGENTPTGSSTTESGTMTGTVGSSGISGGSLASGNTTATYTVTSDPTDYKRGADLTAIAGSYTGSFTVGGTTYKPSLKFDSSGNISGSDTSSNSCTYTGTITVPDKTVNAYEISLTASCLSGGSLQGVGAYFPAATLLSKNSFKTALSNSQSGIYLNLSQ
jgi:hypothetical protein